MRDQWTREQAAEFLRSQGIGDDPHALKVAGILAGTGPYFSRFSVEEYARTRASSVGEFYCAVIDHGSGGRQGRRQHMLVTTASTAEQGFAVPTTYASEILAPLFAPTGILGRCFRVVTPSNNFTQPLDRVADHDDSAGITAKFEDELAEIDQSKVALEYASVAPLLKLTAIVPISEDLYDDAPGLGAYVQRKAPRKIEARTEDEIVRAGNGVGRPLSILKSPALVTQAAEAAQPAGTLVAANATKGKSRMPAHLQADAVAIVHPDAWAQLPAMGNAIYQPGDADAPNGRLLSSPIIVSESCEAPGTPGDLIWASLSQYLVVVKEPALATQTSLHVWFDRGLMALKFRFRFNGLPLWAQPVLSRVGNPTPLTRSPFVVIAARAV